MDEVTGQNMLDSGQGELVAQEAAEAAETVVVDEGAPVVVEDDEGSALGSWTVPELEDMGDEYGIEAKDIEGTGAGGKVVKADWVRVLDARMAEADDEDEGSEAGG
tara:strand:+ start:4328 stop:4645 length:318 start_codon:yes stop_codon:yes gene_type:complete